MIRKAMMIFLALFCAITVSGCNSTTAEPSNQPMLEAIDGGISEQRLSETVKLEVGVNHCEYGEPIQYIEDPQIISEVIKALSGMTVTGLKDTVSSTGDYTWYHLYDAQGNDICGFSLQGGLLLKEDGRYTVEGLNALESVDGIMLIDDWDTYWDNLSDDRNIFEQNYRLSFPSSVFEVSGYYTNQLYHNVAPEDIVSVNIRIDWSDIPPLRSNDREIIDAIYNAMCQMQVLGEASEEGTGETWYVEFYYKEPGENFYSNAYVSFCGNYLESDFAQGGDTTYEVSGMDTLLEAADAEVLEYLKEYRTAS